MKKGLLLLSLIILLVPVAIWGIIRIGNPKGSAKDRIKETAVDDIVYAEHVGGTMYEFEISVSDELFAEKCQKIAEKVERAFEDCAEAEAEVSEANRILLINFADVLGDSYRERKFPDFSELYNLDNRMRKENMLLIAGWGYKESLKEEGELSECISRIEVKKTEELENNITEIIFKIIREERRTYNMVEVVQEREYRCLADIMETDGGPRMICCWITDPAFGIVRTEIQESNMVSGLSEEERKLLAEFADGFAQTLIAKEYPDLSDVFDSENEVGIESRLLMEAFAYQEAIAFEAMVTECYSEILIHDIRETEENAREVVCEIRQQKRTVQGEEEGYSYTGYTCLIDISNVDGKPRIIYSWMDSPGLRMLKESIAESGILQQDKNVTDGLRKFVWDRIYGK
ncbi:MAG: hypothetical protein Q4C58_02470 [Eubacteriales bacterium]|nr:hypothetical protein [Eubacteriales bacterium]